MLQEESRSEPLLLSSTTDVEKEAPESPVKQNAGTNNNLHHHNEHDDLQFYDPTALLDVPREVAFGYLILLTGGAVHYEAPTLEEVKQQCESNSEEVSPPRQQKQQQSMSQLLTEESSSLAYAAITDGNVLHTCFGLKVNGSSATNSTPTIGGKHQSSASSIFCCFPSSSTLDALHLVLPHLSKNKHKMQHLIEVLREVRDGYYDSLEGGGGGALGSSSTAATTKLYMQVIQAYINCFTSIVRYHDTKKYLLKDGSKTPSSNKKKKVSDDICITCYNVLSKLNPFSKKSKNVNPKLEQLQKDTLNDISHGFEGLTDNIWDSLETMATETAFTGVSIEESTASSPKKK